MSDNINSGSSDDESLGRAANRYVSFQIASAVIGGIIFLILLFTVFLPQFNNVNQGFSSMSPSAPPMSSGPSTTMTLNGRPATPEEQKSFNQQFQNH